MLPPSAVRTALAGLRPQLEALPERCWLTGDIIREAFWGGPVATWCVVHDLAHDPHHELCRRLSGPWSPRACADRGQFNVYSWVHNADETATAIAARIEGGRIEVIAPHGFWDVIDGVIRRTRFAAPMDHLRLRHSEWTARRPDLRVIQARAPRFEGGTRYSFQPEWR